MKVSILLDFLMQVIILKDNGKAGGSERMFLQECEWCSECDSQVMCCLLVECNYLGKVDRGEEFFVIFERQIITRGHLFGARPDT